MLSPNTQAMDRERTSSLSARSTKWYPIICGTLLKKRSPKQFVTEWSNRRRGGGEANQTLQWTGRAERSL
jgi:hypothetical protein